MKKKNISDEVRRQSSKKWLVLQIAYVTCTKKERKKHRILKIRRTEISAKARVRDCLEAHRSKKKRNKMYNKGE